MENELLIEMKEYIEDMEETVEGEWGSGRSIDYLLANKKMPELYYKIIKEINQKENNGN